MKYSDKQIADKLAQVEAFEAEYGKNTITIAWRKWCTDPKYRERNQNFQNAVAASIRPNENYLK
jgi:hypothetical protein